MSTRSMALGNLRVPFRSNTATELAAPRTPPSERQRTPAQRANSSFLSSSSSDQHYHLHRNGSGERRSHSESQSRIQEFFEWPTSIYLSTQSLAGSSPAS